MALAHYNAAAGHLLELLATPRPDSWQDFRNEPHETNIARGEVLDQVPAAIKQFAAARTELGRLVATVLPVTSLRLLTPIRALGHQLRVPSFGVGRSVSRDAHAVDVCRCRGRRRARVRD